MESTEPGPKQCLAKDAAPASAAAEPPAICQLDVGDLPGALALSASAQWNQNEADWRMMLTLGQGWGIRAHGANGQEQLAASIVVLPYGTTFAWVSMVLVLPEFQRLGLASRLLRQALNGLASQGRSRLLDATPAGHAVYLQEGFRDTWGFARYRREARDLELPNVEARNADRPPGLSSRPLRDSDWPAIEALDTPAFGASRLPLLRALAQRLPLGARVVEAGGHLRGFVFGRDGREATQIGPLVAADESTANRLLGDVLRDIPGPVYADLLDRHTSLKSRLQQQGFNFQRSFTRMVHGGLGAPGETEHLVLVAGPELG